MDKSDSTRPGPGYLYPYVVASRSLPQFLRALSAQPCREAAQARRWPELHEIKHDGFRVMVRHNARLADLSVSHATFEAAVAKYRDKRICIRDRACVIRSSYRPQG